MRIKTYALTAHTALKMTTCLDGRRNSVTIPGGLTLHSLFQACAWTVWCSYVSSIQRQKDIVRDNWRALSYKTQAFCCRVMLKNIHEAPWGKASTECGLHSFNIRVTGTWWWSWWFTASPICGGQNNRNTHTVDTNIQWPAVNTKLIEFIMCFWKVKTLLGILSLAIEKVSEIMTLGEIQEEPTRDSGCK